MKKFDIVFAAGLSLIGFAVMVATSVVIIRDVFFR